MLVPGVEIPHLCVQCHDYPCVEACPTEALSVSPETEAVLVDKEKCIACGRCTEACPGKIPFIHPADNYVVICDLCDGNPKCVEACAEGMWNALEKTKKDDSHGFKLYAKTPEEITRQVAAQLYGEGWEEGA
jgi:Fe-S-cluster-containing dehydrogenase component